MNLDKERIAILVADVGGSGNFGWAGKWSDSTQHGTSIEELGTTLVDLVRDGWRTCLGFECPVFIPCPNDARALSKQRDGERGKPWCAGAGANSCIIGVQQLCWLLDRLRSNVRSDIRATLDWGEFQAGNYSLYLWEAFVSGPSKSQSHVGDAQIALSAFANALPHPEAASAVICSRPISFAGLALLWSGLSEDLSIIHRSSLVIRA